MGEFDLIKTYFAPLAGPEGFGLLDDAACYVPVPGFDLILTKDTMVEGVHFPVGADPQCIARRLMRVNLSDLAAKGAEPKGYLLSIAWPKNLTANMHANNARAFATGLGTDQGEFGFYLFGGDTVATKGPMVVSATFIGQVPSGAMVKRRGACAGDDVWITGSIGDSFLGLKCLLDPACISDILTPYRDFWVDRYWAPTPRLELSECLRAYATACVDISDGVIADLGHIAHASDVEVVIEIGKLPLSRQSQMWLAEQTSDMRLPMISFGDDYELAFTANPKNRDNLRRAAEEVGLKLTRAGSCRAGGGITCLGALGNQVSVNQSGYTHF